ncbi:MAG: type 2 isopentenyl-diphosphate Delta-isomerase, partial [Candidatus Helarchaeota archaeon]
NEILGETAEKHGIAMQVGSQRAALEDPSLVSTYSIAREKAPTTVLVGNLGGAQFAMEYGIEEAKNAIKMIKADALAIHLNYLQECVQEEGNKVSKGLYDKLKTLKSALSTPLIVKETGCGISVEEAGDLNDIGIDYIDVSGAGGTSWAAVEFHRALDKKQPLLANLAKTYWDWGIPTAISIVECSGGPARIIASGGIRTGLEVAKAISLGADLVGISLPFLNLVQDKDPNKIHQYVETLIIELKTAMFLINSKNLEELKSANLIIRGNTAEWLSFRGFEVKKFAHRQRIALPEEKNKK